MLQLWYAMVSCVCALRAVNVNNSLRNYAGAKTTVEAAVTVNGVKCPRAVTFAVPSNAASHATFACPLDVAQDGCLFECRVALAFDSTSTGDSLVTFTVRVDGQPVWQSVPVNRATVLAPRCRVGVSGASLVTLEVRCKGDTTAAAVWMDPRFTWDRSDAIGKFAVIILSTPGSSVEGVQIFGRTAAAAAASVVASADCCSAPVLRYVCRHEMDIASIPVALKSYFEADPKAASDNNVTVLLAGLDIVSKMFEVRVAHVCPCCYCSILSACVPPCVVGRVCGG